MSFLLLLPLLKSVSAQGCGKDVLIDDFSTTQSKFFDNANRIINQIGGDYGTDGRTTFSIDTTARTLTVIPQENENVYFFVKFDERACFDLTNYYAFQFDLIAPVGFTGSFTLTQMKADCSGRATGSDSVYLPLSRYYTTPGLKQTVTLPFRDFASLASGNGTFDFKHLKDWTFVDMKPHNQPFVFSNLRLIGGAPGCCPLGQACSSASASASPNPTDYQLGSGSGSTAGQGITVLLGTLGFIYIVFAL